jgi:hypothetical protein
MINELSGMPTVEQVVEEQMTECNIMIEVRGDKGWEKI